ncbi:MAG: methyltransferase domain-containing protein [Mycobacterium sp.]|nr:methyltransferase domain-containing protein [Mycobacterium sp.]
MTDQSAACEDSATLDDEQLTALLRNDRYPRSSRYSARWMLDGAMGPNPVWLAEALTDVLPLRPGMRVLDMGCGNVLTSIFLAKEFDVEVWATDLWVSASDNWQRITQADLADRVFPIYAEAHALPFAEEFFDALVSIDAYHYFGTDDLYIGYYSRFVKPDGRIGFVVPGVDTELDAVPPPHLPNLGWEACSFHSPQWWRRHLEKTGLVHVDIADRLPDGWRDWLQWDEAGDQYRGRPSQEPDMLRIDAGRVFGFTRVMAHRIGQTPDTTP